MGTSYLGGVCGMANATLENSDAYLQSWMRVLRHDATLLVHAAAQAQRAADYIQNLHPAVGAEEASTRARSTGMQDHHVACGRTRGPRRMAGAAHPRCARPRPQGPPLAHRRPSPRDPLTYRP